MLSVRCKNRTLLSDVDYMSLLQLRHKVFRERLKWDVKSENSHESDEYDTQETQYLYVKDDIGNLFGCWRILPTTGTYMLKDTFNQCLGEEEAPESPTIYELSRFAVDKTLSSGSHFTPGKITMEMFRAVYKYAVYNGIDYYVTVTSVGIEKLLKRIGLPHERIGDKQVHMLGNTRSVVLLIPINEKFRDSVGLNTIDIRQNFVFEADTLEVEAA